MTESGPLGLDRRSLGRRPRSRAGGLTAVASLALLAALASASCSSSVPRTIRDTPTARLTVAEVQQAPDRAIGQRVRWGGNIIAVANLAESTQIEVLARPLDNDGEPRRDAEGQGRFIAELSGFVDPVEYPNDRLLTVVGPIAGLITRDVGEYPYRYPVVAVTSRYIWPEVEALPYPYPPYPWYGGYGYRSWYGPFDPWYGPHHGPPRW